LYNCGSRLAIDNFIHQVGRTPFHLAAWNGNTEVIGLLLNDGFPIETADKVRIATISSSLVGYIRESMII